MSLAPTNTLTTIRPAEPVTVVTIERMPRQPIVAAQILRAIADHGIPIDVLVSGHSRQHGQLAITVHEDQAADVVELASAVAGRFGVGPVTADASWMEVVVEVWPHDASGPRVAEVFEYLSVHGFDTRAVTAAGSTVTCVVRHARVESLAALAMWAGAR